tara:strand:+ start:289 stop:528 length:240 start_codon:yes stop_codon:yes gene_type:complete
MKTAIKKEKVVEDIIKKLKPNLIKIIKKKDYNFMKDDLLDSFDIINILVELKKYSKKNISMSKVTKKNFSNIKNISKLI